jgi:hypothetical protein
MTLFGTRSSPVCHWQECKFLSQASSKSVVLSHTRKPQQGNRRDNTWHLHHRYLYTCIKNYITSVLSAAGLHIDTFCINEHLTKEWRSAVTGRTISNSKCSPGGSTTKIPPHISIYSFLCGIWGYHCVSYECCHLLRYSSECSSEVLRASVLVKCLVR